MAADDLAPCVARSSAAVVWPCEIDSPLLLWGRISIMAEIIRWIMAVALLMVISGTILRKCQNFEVIHTEYHFIILWDVMKDDYISLDNSMGSVGKEDYLNKLQWFNSLTPLSPGHSELVTLHDMVKSGEWSPCPEIVPRVGAGKKHATWPTLFNNVIRLSTMGVSVAIQLIMHVLGSANRWVTVFKIHAGPPTLTGKNGVSPASFPSLPYINFGKIVLRSGKFQILFWRLGLMQERCNSIASAMELCLSCTNTLTWGSRMIAFSKHCSWWSW